MKKVAVFLLIAGISAAVLAQEQNAEEKVKTTLKTRKMACHLHEASLDMVLLQIANLAETGIVIDPSLDNTIKITISQPDATLETILNLALEPLKFDYIIKKDGTIFVSTKERIAEMRGKTQKEEAAGLEPEQLLFVMKDRSKLKGKVKIEKWNLKTAYGLLSIPTAEVTKIRFPREAKEGEEALKEDEVATVRFTATGNLEIDKLELETAHGKLTISKSDIVEILFPEPALTKSFEVKPTGEWLDTGIKLKKGEKVSITAEGALEWKAGIKFSPDGSAVKLDTDVDSDLARESSGKTFPLMAKIGENGEQFKTGSSCDKEVDKGGNLYLKIEIPEGSETVAETLKGSYNVKVLARSALKPTEEEEAAASNLLSQAQSFDRQNPYEDKEIVSEGYKEVFEKYPDTKAAEEAREKYEEVMDRRR